MKGYERYKKNKEIPTIKIITCPACDKNRLRKYANADGGVTPASEETVEVREEIRFLEVCQFCSQRYSQADQKFIVDNMRKMTKALRESRNEDTESDHKDFSLN